MSFILYKKFAFIYKCHICAVIDTNGAPNHNYSLEMCLKCGMKLRCMYSCYIVLEK